MIGIQRRVDFALGLENRPQVAVSLGEIRAHFQCLFIVGDSRVVVAQSVESQPPIVIGFRVLGVQAQHLGIIVQRFLQKTKIVSSARPVEPGTRDRPC